MAAPVEQPVSFANGDESLRGVLHLPPSGDARTAVVFLHGWSGDRTGPHRMFVHAARRLTELGCACLRFDFRGRGDSDGATAEAGIQGMIRDTICATDYLESAVAPRTLLLLGLCSGGKVAVGAAANDRRIRGLILWSAEALGPLRSVATNRRKTLRALGAYARKLTSPATWRKIVTGRVNTGLVRKAVIRHETPADAEMAQEALLLDRFRDYEGDALFIYGSNDPDVTLAARNYEAYCRRRGLPHSFHAIPGANHSFYGLDWEEQVIALTEQWVRENHPGD